MNIQSKAEKAAIKMANEKTDKANAFYEYHKEIIDEYRRLERLAGEAQFTAQMIKVKRVLRDNETPF